MNFAHPWVLALILPAWLALLAAALRPGARRSGEWLRTGLSALAGALLVTALAAPSLRSSTSGLPPGRVVIVQDVSKSMALARRGDPAQVLAHLVADLPGGRAGLVQVAGSVGLVIDALSPEAARLASAFPSDTAAEASEPQTDLAAGLHRAGALLGPQAGLVVVYSDGRETRGDAARAATALASHGLQVHAILPDLAAPSDVRIVSVEPLGRPAPGDAVRLQVRLTSTVAADAEIRVVRRARPEGGQAALPPARVHVDPAAGATALIDDVPPGAGLYVYTATVLASADRAPQDNEASCLVRVGGVREVVYVYEGAAPRAALEWLKVHAPAALRFSAVSASPAHAVPGPSADIVVLDNVSAWALGPESAEQLAARVTRGGLGLLALGGDSSFSAGGYGTSPLDEVLPVSSRTAERPPLELILVVDSSGSMNETVGSVQKLTLAKQAILSLRPALSEGDRVGIVAFAGEPRVVSPTCPASQWSRIEQRLVALQAGGGTRITPALEAAIRLLSPAGAGDPRTVRHVLLLSDGRSEDFAVERIVAALGAARASASAVATGADADAPKLAALAAGTRGRLYRPDDLAGLAETFLRDMAYVRGEGLREEKRPARWGDPAPVWPRTGTALPDVPAFNVTRAKEGAAVAWATGPGEKAGGEAPLLATWRRGLGKTAAMPWPVSAAAGPWLTDGRLGRYLTDVLAYLTGPQVPVDWSARLVSREAGAGAERRLVRVERRTDALEKPAAGFSATVFRAEPAAPEELVLAQVEPGIYEADLGGDGAAAALVVVHATGNDAGVVNLSAPGAPPREYAGFGVDREQLDRIVRAGGGQVHESPQSVVRAVERLEAAALVPVGIYLVWAAGMVVAAQVALRLMGRL